METTLNNPIPLVLRPEVQQAMRAQQIAQAFADDRQVQQAPPIQALAATARQAQRGKAAVAKLQAPTQPAWMSDKIVGQPPAPAWSQAPLVGQANPKTPAWKQAPETEGDWGQGDTVIGKAPDDADWGKGDIVIGKPQPNAKPKSPSALQTIAAALPKIGKSADDLIRGAADTLSFGMADEIAAGLSSLTGIGGKQGDYAGNVSKERAKDANASGFRTAGQLGAALAIPTPAAAVRTLPRILASSAAGGAAYGLGSGEGDISDRLPSAAAGATAGLAGGVVANKLGKFAQGVAEKVSPKIFAKAQLANNPATAQFDAIAAQRLAPVLQRVQSATGGVKLSKSQMARTLAMHVDRLEEAGAPTAEQFRALGLPQDETAAYLHAVANPHVLSDDEINALRTSNIGDIVADHIEEARALRRLAPPPASQESSGGIGSHLMDLGASAAGAALGGPGGAVLGNIASAGAKAASRSLRAERGASSALDRYNSIIKSAPGHAAVLDQLGTSLPSSASSRLLQMGKEVSKSKALRAYEEAQAELAAKAANRRVSIKNDQDNIPSGGGLRGLIHDRTGLLPAEQDTGFLKMLNDGLITPDQYSHALSSPEKLMNGKAGLAIVDRLAQWADDGVLARNPKWQAPSAAQEQIRNPLAYAATAKANQHRVTETLAQVHKIDGIDPVARETIASAVQRIGNSSKRGEAEEAIRQVMEQMPDDDAVAVASSLLTPLLEAYRGR